MNEFLEWFSKLTHQSLEDINLYYTQDAYFKDPFQEINGRDQIQNVFEHMFTGPLENNKFVFQDKVQENNSLFVTWDYRFTFKKVSYKIHGSSLLKFKDNKCFFHRDYWDTGEELYLKIPILRSIHKYIQKKMITSS